MNNIKKLAFYSILLLSISGVQIAFFPGPTVRTLIEFITYIIISIVFVSYSPFFKTRKLPHNNLIKLFLVYGLIVAIHSAAISDTYEQWRYLITVYLPFLLIPGFLYIASVPRLTKEIFKILLYITVPLSFTFIILNRITNNENVFYIKYISFIYLFIPLIPYIKTKWKIIIILISVISLFLNLNARTNIISICISYIICLTFYVNDNIFLKKTLRYLTIYLPLILTLIGAFTNFNIFSFLNDRDNYIITTGKSEINMTTDSRTTIYKDAFNNLNDKNGWILGVGVTDIYKTGLADELFGYNKGRLGGSESGFLNFLTFGGVIYSILIFLLFYKITKLAIYKSNNSIIPIIGLYISFQWFFLFIENPIDINFYWVSLFIAMGICLSPEFRKMSDIEIKLFLKNI